MTPTTRFLLAALTAAPLALAGCASRGHAAAAPPPAVTAAPAHPENISPAHPYCMWVRETGQLSECFQFAFGRCQVWGGRCHVPGWMAARDAGTGGAPAAGEASPGAAP
jgi:hypothetical protein